VWRSVRCEVLHANDRVELSLGGEQDLGGSEAKRYGKSLGILETSGHVTDLSRDEKPWVSTM
jgi:hypothetical protein